MINCKTFFHLHSSGILLVHLDLLTQFAEEFKIPVFRLYKFSSSFGAKPKLAVLLILVLIVHVARKTKIGNILKIILTYPDIFDPMEGIGGVDFACRNTCQGHLNIIKNRFIWTRDHLAFWHIIS